MQITCYSGFSKELNSTKQPTSGTDINVTLKEPTSVLEPVFIIQNYDLSWNYIRWGVRYYYVRDTVIVHNNIAEYHCVSDPMATFKGDIGSSSQYIVRAYDSYDTDIIDLKYPVKARPTFDSFVFEGDLVDLIDSTGFYVLGVKAPYAKAGVAYYIVDSTNMTALINYMFSGLWCTATDITQELQKMLNNPMDYISSCYWFPFSTSGMTFTDTIDFGFWSSPASGLRLTEAERTQILFDTVTIDKHPQAVTRGDYLLGAPFTRVTASIYGFGRIPLNANLLIQSQTIGAYIRVDLFTGIAELSMASGGGDLCKMTSQFGVPVQLSQVTQDIIKPFMQTVGASVAFAEGDIIGTITGIGSAIMGALSPQVQTTGSVGSKIAYEENPHIFVEWYPIADEDILTIGRPYCKQSTISSHSGFLQCSNVDIKTSASPSEKSEIKQHMESGFFYE